MEGRWDEFKHRAQVHHAVPTQDEPAEEEVGVRVREATLTPTCVGGRKEVVRCLSDVLAQERWDLKLIVGIIGHSEVVGAWGLLCLAVAVLRFGLVS